VLNIFLQYQSEPPVTAPAFTDTASALCSLFILLILSSSVFIEGQLEVLVGLSIETQIAA